MQPWTFSTTSIIWPQITWPILRLGGSSTTELSPLIADRTRPNGAVRRHPMFSFSFLEFVLLIVALLSGAFDELPALLGLIS